MPKTVMVIKSVHKNFKILCNRSLKIKKCFLLNWRTFIYFLNTEKLEFKELGFAFIVEIFKLFNGYFLQFL